MSSRSPNAVFEKLLEGNKRFTEGSLLHPNSDEDRRGILRQGQSPDAVVLACSDSRVPVELIFDVGFGDLFVVRTAGEILGDSVLGSVSYAVNSLEVPLVVVLGHESCGAVAAAVEALETGEVPIDHRRTLIERVAPSLLKARAQGVSDSADLERKHAVTVANQVVGNMPALGARMSAGLVGVAAARYRLEDGSVEILATYGLDRE